MPTLAVLPPADHAAMDVDTDDDTVDLPGETEPVSEDGIEEKAVDLSQDDAAEAIPKSQEPKRTRKRRVTPVEESDSRKSQQKKVNQLTLGTFFFEAKKDLQSPSVKSTDATPKRKQSRRVSRPRRGSAKTEDSESEPAGKDEPTEPSGDRSDDKSPMKGDSSDENESAVGKPVTPLPTNEQDQSQTESPTLSNPKTPQETEKPAPTSSNIEKNEDSLHETDATAEPVAELSEERKQVLENYNDMEARYVIRAQGLVEGARQGLEEENFEMSQLQQDQGLPKDQDFPDSVVFNMALLVEGSALPLSKLVSMVCGKLAECHAKQFPEQAVNSKIKLLAKRKSHLGDPFTPTSSIDLFEDEQQDRMWRWELITADILPSAILPNVRKARTARKKLLGHHTAVLKLLQTLQEAQSLIRDKPHLSLDRVLATISRDEEKVLKYEREAEKQRLAQQAKKKKAQEIEARRREKEQLAEEKRKAKERKKQELEKRKLEKEKEKQEAIQAREAGKRRKSEERDRKVQQKKQEEVQKKETLSKQKACLMSFFGATKREQSKPSTESTRMANASQQEGTRSRIPTATKFDVDEFRAIVESQDSEVEPQRLFENLSSSAVRSRRRRTRKVDISVYVTMVPENSAFDAQPFAEQRVIQVPNKYRFLSFHEDCRPAYHGTWCKESTVVTGRNPFGKDTSFLDYDNDSEAEWEEGDDEIGEDVEDDAQNQEDDDDGSAKMYDYDDGFCIADDQYLDTDDNVDEETRELYKKKLQTGDGTAAANRICVLAPSMDGRPLRDNTCSGCVEGFRKAEALDLLGSHTAIQPGEVPLWLDAFPPEKLDEVNVVATEVTETTPPANSSSSRDEYTLEQMKLLASFIHCSQLTSKEKLIEELRNSHPSSFSSRAKAVRKLDSIAVKKKQQNGGGVYWEVKSEILKELGLNNVLGRELPGETSEKTEDVRPPKRKLEKAKATDTTTQAQGIEPRKKKRKVIDTKPEVVDTAKKTCPEKPSGSSVASANVLANFLIKRKRKEDK